MLNLRICHQETEREGERDRRIANDCEGSQNYIHICIYWSLPNSELLSVPMRFHETERRSTSFNIEKFPPILALYRARRPRGFVTNWEIHVRNAGFCWRLHHRHDETGIESSTKKTSSSSSSELYFIRGSATLIWLNFLRLMTGWMYRSWLALHLSVHVYIRYLPNFDIWSSPLVSESKERDCMAQKYNAERKKVWAKWEKRDIGKKNHRINVWHLKMRNGAHFDHKFFPRCHMPYACVRLIVCVCVCMRARVLVWGWEANPIRDSFDRLNGWAAVAIQALLRSRARTYSVQCICVYFTPPTHIVHAYRRCSWRENTNRYIYSIDEYTSLWYNRNHLHQ